MRRKIEIILQHGWAFDGSCWRGWMPHMRENQDYDLSIQTPDRGYFGNSRVLRPFEQSDSLKILVAHSLGLHLLPEWALRFADLVVLASSFKHFHGDTELQRKRSKKIIARMLSRFEEEPQAVLDEFYSNCYSPLLSSQPLLKRDSQSTNLDLLYRDLELLNNSCLDLNPLSGRKVLLLHGSEDIIVPVVQSHLLKAELPGSSLIVFEGAGHSLALTHAAPVWISLRTHLRSMLGVKA